MSDRRINRKWVIRGLVVVAIIAFFVFRDQLPSINLDKIIEDLSKSLGSWTYLLVGLSLSWRRARSSDWWLRASSR